MVRAKDLALVLVDHAVAAGARTPGAAT